MRRLFVPSSEIGQGRVSLGPEARHYLCDVLRLGPGAPVEVFDGEGGVYEAALAASKDALLLGARRALESMGPPIWLAFALAKGEKNDLVVQKATELGAARLLIFRGERSVVRLTGERARGRVLRWQRIAADAARQCGRADVPEIAALPSLKAAFESSPPALVRIAFSTQGGASLGALLREGAAGYLAAVGPEGGFSAPELAACKEAGCEMATLGPRILRAETAAIAVMALLGALAQP